MAGVVDAGVAEAATGAAEAGAAAAVAGAGAEGGAGGVENVLFLFGKCVEYKKHIFCFKKIKYTK